MCPGPAVAVVTGASRGIGRQIVQHLVADGFTVGAAARPSALLDETCAETGAVAVPLDVTDTTGVVAALADVESNLGPVDLLVNNAGLAGGSTPTWEHDPDLWWEVFDVNVKGIFNCARAVLPSMVSRGEGRIVNVSSNAAFSELGDDEGPSISSAYMASKAAVIRFTEALAAEVRRLGVTVLAVSPGTVKTDMTEVTFAEYWDDEDFWTPPEAVAELVSFIATGALDGLSGRYVHASRDNWSALGTRHEEIVRNDLLALRLRTLEA